MATEVQVAQLAATLIGTEARITSLQDDKAAVRAMRDVWDLQRRETIREGAWNFAARRTGLSAEAGVAPAELYPYAFRYPLPGDSLRLIEVLNRGYEDRYQLEDDKVLCDAAGPLYVRYSVDVTEPGKWDDQFASAFAHRIAWACGNKVAGSGFDRQGTWNAYQAVLGRAKTVDAIESPSIDQAESSWVEARIGSARTGTFGAGIWEPS